jgi:hypothetical protein
MFAHGEPEDQRGKTLEVRTKSNRLGLERSPGALATGALAVGACSLAKGPVPKGPGKAHSSIRGHSILFSVIAKRHS